MATHPSNPRTELLLFNSRHAEPLASTPPLDGDLLHALSDYPARSVNAKTNAQTQTTKATTTTTSPTYGKVLTIASPIGVQIVDRGSGNSRCLMAIATDPPIKTNAALNATPKYPLRRPD